MSEKAGHHDTLVYRLAQMLVKLNQGERLDPQALAEEFGVALRTIQRDLNERFAYLPLEKIEGRYRLDPAFLGKLSTKDIERFASLSPARKTAANNTTMAMSDIGFAASRASTCGVPPVGSATVSAKGCCVDASSINSFAETDSAVDSGVITGSGALSMLSTSEGSGATSACLDSSRSCANSSGIASSATCA